MLHMAGCIGIGHSKDTSWKVTITTLAEILPSSQEPTWTRGWAGAEPCQDVKWLQGQHGRTLQVVCPGGSRDAGRRGC